MYDVSKQATAEFFAVTTQSLDRWFAQGCPVAKYGADGSIRLINLSAAAQWRIKRADETKDERRAQRRQPIDHAKERLTRAQAELAEMEVREKMGELVRMPAVAIYWSTVVTAMRSKILSVPTKAAAMIATPETLQATTETITRFVHEALAEIAGDAFPDEIRARFAEAESTAESKSPDRPKRRAPRRRKRVEK